MYVVPTKGTNLIAILLFVINHFQLNKKLDIQALPAYNMFLLLEKFKLS